MFLIHHTIQWSETTSENVSTIFVLFMINDFQKHNLVFGLFSFYFNVSKAQAARTPQIQNLMIHVMQHDHCHFVYFLV